MALLKPKNLVKKKKKKALKRSTTALPRGTFTQYQENPIGNDGGTSGA